MKKLDLPIVETNRHNFPIEKFKLQNGRIKSMLKSYFTIFVSLFFIAPIESKAETLKMYKYKYPKADLIISVIEAEESKAFKSAAKLCFETLTKNKYPGEEKGLEIIDICANPKLIQVRLL